MRTLSLPIIFSALAVAGCVPDLKVACSPECPSGQVCRARICQSTDSIEDARPVDAARDATPLDAELDARPDAAVDVAAVDLALVDAHPDAAPDVPDAHPDALVEPDAGTDARPPPQCVFGPATEWLAEPDPSHLAVAFGGGPALAWTDARGALRLLTEGLEAPILDRPEAFQWRTPLLAADAAGDLWVGGIGVRDAPAPEEALTALQIGRPDAPRNVSFEERGNRRSPLMQGEVLIRDDSIWVTAIQQVSGAERALLGRHPRDGGGFRQLSAVTEIGDVLARPAIKPRPNGEGEVLTPMLEDEASTRLVRVREILVDGELAGGGGAQRVVPGVVFGHRVLGDTWYLLVRRGGGISLLSIELPEEVHAFADAPAVAHPVDLVEAQAIVRSEFGPIVVGTRGLQRLGDEGLGPPLPIPFEGGVPSRVAWGDGPVLAAAWEGGRLVTRTLDCP